jgi:predicted short-subunit dehydrogenase-like oxidoreductase (DUF2520 family)
MRGLLCCAAVALKPLITIVGPGALGTALAHGVHRAGYPIAEIVYRTRESDKRARRLAKAVGANALQFSDADFDSSAAPARLNGRGPFPHVVWICVGDSAIARTAEALATTGEWKGKVVFHSSGALTSSELLPLKRKGATVASVHPLMTFVPGARGSMKAVPFALEGDDAGIRIARQIVKELGGESFVVEKKDKPLYHALGAFVSPLIVAMMAAAEKIGRELRIKPAQTRRLVAPILQQTVSNYLKQGPAAAFSGPIIRGDEETVRKNLAALKRVRGAEEIYRALAKLAVEELPSKNPKAVKRAIR